nr:ribonuclease H-like domain-containing protein [Tanacetum cinerariifolium]
GNPHHALKDKGVIDSGSSRHMTRNISYLSDFEAINGGYVSFGGNPKGGKITGKGKIRIGKLDFDDVYFVKELKFNLFSVSHMCNKKNSVLFTDTECVVLSFDFKLPDENHVLLRVPRENNMYNVDLKNIVPSGDLTCLFAKATLDESNLWHKRLGHINFKTMNKLVKGNLVRGLPSKVFENNHTCVACKKGKKHRASCKTKPISYVIQPLQRVLVTKPHNKTPYELLLGRTPSIGFMRPFGCLVTILNTLNPLGKFDGKADEGFLVGYSSMNYQPVVTGNQPNSSAGLQEYFDADPQHTDADTTFEVKEHESEVYVSPSSSTKTKKHDDKTKREAIGKSAVDTPVPAIEPNSTNSTNTFSAVGPTNNVVSSNSKLGGKSSFMDPSQYPDDPDMPAFPIPTTRVHNDYSVSQIIGDLSLAPQTRSMTRMVKDQCRPTQINNKNFHTCMFACFLSQEEPKRVHQALKDPSWIEAMQEKLFQFKMQKGWVLVDLPKVKRIFRYLKGKPHLGLWYPKDSPFNRVAYSDSNYAGASLDRKSITGGCQLLGYRLISWQYKKQTIVATSSTEAEVHTLEQSNTAQDLVIKKLQKKVKRIERKIKARTPGMTLFNIGNFRKKSLDKENVSKQGRYLKTRPMFEESNFDNINEWLMKTMIEPNEEDEVGS